MLQPLTPGWTSREEALKFFIVNYSCVSDIIEKPLLN